MWVTGRMGRRDSVPRGTLSRPNIGRRCVVEPSDIAGMVKSRTSDFRKGAAFWVTVEGMDKAVFHVEHFEVTPSSELPHWRPPPRKRSPRSTVCSGAGRSGIPQPRSLRHVCGSGSQSGEAACPPVAKEPVPVSGQDFTPFISSHSACQTDHSGCQQQEA